METHQPTEQLHQGLAPCAAGGAAISQAAAAAAQASGSPQQQQFGTEQQAGEHQHQRAEDTAAVAHAADSQQAAAGDRGDAAAANSDSEEGQEEAFDAELATWLAGRLQRVQPGAELTVGSVQVLGRLLDEIAVRVLEEAQRMSASSSSGIGTEPQAGTASAGPAPTSALTSLDIHKALKRVLPGEPAGGTLRPYLPAVTKQAWHLDKQSLKGIKRQKQAAGAAAAAGPAPDDGEAAAGSKENQQQPAA